MLTELQHAQSEDEAQEFEEVMQASWAVRIGAALMLLVGAASVALYIGCMAVLIGLSSCATAAYTPRKNVKPTHRGIAEAERGEPADSASLSTL